MIYYVDIDNTVMSQPYIGSTDYKDHIPIPERIEKINRLFDEGHTIVYYTARGTRSGIDWYELTKTQLESSGARYDELSVGDKPHFDVIIDDKAINAEDFF